MSEDSNLTPDQRLAAFESPLGLSRVSHPEYESRPVHELFNVLGMQAVLAATNPLLNSAYRYMTVSVPPRHSKSEAFSIALPAWALGRYPNLHIISVTYESGL